MRKLFIVEIFSFTLIPVSFLIQFLNLVNLYYVLVTIL